MFLEAYFPVLLFIVIGTLVGIVPMLLGRLLGPHKPDPQKLSQYECGFEAFGDARMKFDIRFYLVAILFILFDIEVIFLMPWAANVKELGLMGYWAVMLFLASWSSASPMNGKRAPSNGSSRRRCSTWNVEQPKLVGNIHGRSRHLNQIARRR